MLLNSGMSGTGVPASTAAAPRSALRPMMTNDENAHNSVPSGHAAKTLHGGGGRTALGPKKSLSISMDGNSKNGGGLGGGGIAKTPGASRGGPRRAFGDISNRKAARGADGGGGGNGGGGLNAKTPKAVKFHNNVTKTSGLGGVGGGGGGGGTISKSAKRTPFSVRNGNNNNNNKNNKGNNKGDMSARKKTHNHRSVRFGPPVQSQSINIAPSSKMQQQHQLDEDDDLSDVELPAGGLWDPADFFDDGGNRPRIGSLEELDIKGLKEEKRTYRQRCLEMQQRAYDKSLEEADAQLARDLEQIALEDYEGSLLGGMGVPLDDLDDDSLIDDIERTLHTPAGPIDRYRPEEEEFAL